MTRLAEVKQERDALAEKAHLLSLAFTSPLKPVSSYLAKLPAGGHYRWDFYEPGRVDGGYVLATFHYPGQRASLSVVAYLDELATEVRAGKWRTCGGAAAVEKFRVRRQEWLDATEAAQRHGT